MTTNPPTPPAPRPVITQPFTAEGLRPRWRRVDTPSLGIIEVRAPTVAVAAKIPAIGWWLECARNLDGTPILPDGFDVRDLDSIIQGEIVAHILAEDSRPFQLRRGD